MEKHPALPPGGELESVAVLSIGPGKSQRGDPGVMLQLSAGALSVDLHGEPVPGIFFLPWQARRAAYQLLFEAEEMEARAKLGLTS